jgi:hypothetical protein
VTVGTWILWGICMDLAVVLVCWAAVLVIT